MKSKSLLLKSLIALLVAVCTLPSFGQKTVGLDNWYNHETNKKTGKIFHYTWDDTEFSGFSQLGDLFKQRHAELKTVSEAASKKSLAGLNVYIIVDPDTTSENPNPNYLMPEDIKAITAWVKNGGVLLLMTNDKPNCEFTHTNNLAKEFGMHFNPVTLNPVVDRKWDMAAETNLPNHPIFKGVKKIYMKEVSSISVSGQTKKVLVDAGNAYIAEVKYGKGFVVAVSDPWLYNEYIDHALLPADFENLKAANNLVDYLLSKVKK